MTSSLRGRGGPLPLRIRLERERGPEGVTSSVTFELAADVGEPVQVAGCSPLVLGLPQDISDLECPPRRSPRVFLVPQQITRAIHEAARKIGDGRWEALWLEFPRPSGCLSMLPWERMLHYGDHGLPIVRRPYSLVRPWTPEDSLEVVLCASVLPPPANPAYGELPRTASGAASEAVDTILHTVRTVIGEVRRRTRVHVFAAPMLQDALRPHAGRHADLELIVHDPATAAGAGGPQDPTDPVHNPWLRWIRGELGQCAADVVHVIGDGALMGGEGTLILQQLTENGADGSHHGPTAVGAAELSTFLMQVGAWSLVLSGTPGNVSDCGLRELADSVARVQPGSMLVHESAHDPRLTALASGYAFLYRTEDTRPPVTNALSTWAYPLTLDYHFNSGAEPVTLNAARLLLDEKGHTAIYGDRIENVMAAEATPMWLAASIRYLERVQAQWLPPPSGNDDKSCLAPWQDAKYALNQAVSLLERVLWPQDRGPGAGGGVPGQDRGPGAGGVPGPARIPGPSRVPEAERVPETERAPDTSRTPETSRTPKTERTPETSRTPKTERAPEASRAPDTSHALDTSHAPDTERVPGAENARGRRRP
ncbi:hypothetical protein [Streptomyces sp. MST-110588]|uniref:hypothetical protein n=1 Tax=Streptomyces sp. MST-110588 TaxID=2833628 RepID=UPI001F5D6F0B|nr:hypothetical protein [Streptomyces sp. MST-110588]UNO42891.1 hypothetical protein KGS77_29490 [Streptomyces sp. MST-110588]